MNPLQRIFRNSAAPIVAQLVNRAMDLGFALVVLRALGAEGNGAYVYAVQIWLYMKTFTDFGLGVLATRDVSQRPELAGEYLGLTTILRLVLWATALPLMVAFAFVNWRWLGSSGASTVALILLIASIVPDSWSDAANAICNAREEMVRPAILTVVKNVIKTALGLGFLLTGWGVIGLALTALITNVIAMWLFTALLRGLGVRASWHRPGPDARRLLGEAWPLLLNNLLAGLFFSFDAVILKSARGEAELGIYNAPYKLLNMLLLVPQYGTLALFPHFSRLAAEGSAAFAETYALAIKLLLALALPICVATTFVAPDLIWFLAGSQFLPDGGTALRLLIWFLPLSYVNGLTQYVLIAAGMQRAITPAFAITFAFNLGANLLFTPRYGLVAASIITVLSEVVLLLPFVWFLRRRLVSFPAPGVALRPIAAATAMGLLGWLTLRALGDAALAPWIAATLGGAAYCAVLVLIGGVGATERRLVLRLLGRAT
jgi:O-antigen/teichoic acid export membrane protein